MATTLPPELIERARRIAAGEVAAVPTRDASTVVLLRDSPVGLEVHLQRRVASMAFAPNMHVFPGGRVDASDFAVPIALPAHWGDLLGAEPPLAAALVVAAVRETFEEAGVLLTETLPPGDLAALRVQDFGGLAAVPDPTLLRPWSRWITPEFESRRYDTRFFLAALPDGQDVADDDAGGEADATMWISPTEALRRHREGDLAMMPPTVYTLGELADLPGVVAAMGAAEGRPVPLIQPGLRFDGDGAEFVLGDDAGTPA